jgi:cytochrome c oxidase cbb3-type subunit 3
LGARESQQVQAPAVHDRIISSFCEERLTPRFPTLYPAPVKALCFLLALTASLGLAQTEKKNPFENNAQAAEAGRGIFRIYCSPCHGIRAEGGRGPDLTRGVYSAGERDADLLEVISKGVPGTEMPSFSVSLGDENIFRVITYLRSATRRDAEKVTGDALAGERLFWGKGACGQCHRVGTRGGRMGPDLTRVGRSRSLQYLRESVVSPNADLTPGYATITVVTRDGKKIAGVQRGFDNFSAQLMDPRENYYSFLKSDVTSVTREYRSLMPETYAKLFSPSELNDLVAYLTGLGARQ